MDVAKYIGLFLLKNNFVYVHGLGNLEIRKRPATYDGTALEGPAYEVIVTNQGSIDDNLANFIATNEQISISKASNALREFSQKARSDMQAGKPVIIPSIGTFVEDGGTTSFVTEPEFRYTPPPIPSVRIARRQDETVFPTNADLPPVKPRYIDPETEIEESRSISWVKVGAWLLLLIVLIILAIWGYNYLNSRDTADIPPLIETPVEDTVSAAPVTPPDTTLMQADSDALVATENGLMTFDVVLNAYSELSKAQRREQQLKSYGNKVELIAEEDSSLFYVTLPVVQIAAADTSRLLDSLKRVFNPSDGVWILR